MLNQARELRLGRPPAPCDVGVIGEPGHARVEAEHGSEVRRAFGVVLEGQSSVNWLLHRRSMLQQPTLKSE